METSKIYIDPYYFGKKAENFIKIATLLVDEVYVYDPLEFHRRLNLNEIKLLSEKRIIMIVLPNYKTKDYEKHGFDFYLTRKQLIDDLDFWFIYDEVEKNLLLNEKLINKLLSYWKISQNEASILIESISWDYLIINILPNLSYILPSGYYQDIFNTILPYLVVEDPDKVDYNRIIEIDHFIRGLTLKVPSNISVEEIIYLRKRGVHKNFSKWFIKYYSQIRNVRLYSNEEGVTNRLIMEFRDAVNRFNKKIERIIRGLYVGAALYNIIVNLLGYSMAGISIITNLTPMVAFLIKRKILKRNWMIALIEIRD